MGVYDVAADLAQQSTDALKSLSNFDFTDATKKLNTNVYAANFQGGSWQLHHTIPMELMETGTLVGDKLRELTREGLFSVRDGVKNGIWLPSDQATATATALARHLSSHAN